MREQWNLETYNPREPHTKSTDDLGHSAYYRVRIPDDWSGMIGKWVEDRDFPEYQTAADFIRDAIYHRLAFWQKNGRDPEGAVGRMMAREAMLTKVRRATQQFDAQVRFTDEMEDLATRLAQAQDWQALWLNMGEWEDDAREAFDEPYLDRILERVTYWRKRADRF